MNDNSLHDHIDQYTHAVAFMIFGCIISQFHGYGIPLMYLQHFEDLDDVGLYSWDNATLAILYHELCGASEATKYLINGLIELLLVTMHVFIYHKNI